MRYFTHNKALSDPVRVMGMMSGTSVDAVDACVAELSVKNNTFQYVVQGTYSVSVPAELRQRLLKCMRNKPVGLDELCALNVAVGELFAKTALGLMERYQLTKEDIDCIGSHGQTVYHLPVLHHDGENRQLGGTLQIGESSIIAEKTGIPTVADFRPRDMAAGGQGAPLVCFADLLLFQDAEIARCVQNIGGIANVTVIPPSGSIVQDRLGFEEKIACNTTVKAFDTGPGNMLIDAAAALFFNRPYDRDGLLAQRGTLNTALFERLVQHAYLSQHPPKTTGREQFGTDFFELLLGEFPDVLPLDWLATLTRYTAYSIANAYHQFVFPEYAVKEVILGGGGAKNGILKQFLQDAFVSLGYPDIQLYTHAKFNIDDQYKEALAFSVLAWRSYHHLYNTLPSCTGAKHPVVMGKWCL